MNVPKRITGFNYQTSIFKNLLRTLEEWVISDKYWYCKDTFISGFGFGFLIASQPIRQVIKNETEAIESTAASVTKKPHVLQENKQEPYKTNRSL
jgi:hypothetical protein